MASLVKSPSAHVRSTQRFDMKLAQPQKLLRASVPAN
jgi:hypothetical protein